jgi:alkaline phosphatase D
VATSVTSGGDGNDTVQDAELRENPWIKTLPYVSTPGAPAQTKATFVLQDGQPGLQPA